MSDVNSHANEYKRKGYIIRKLYICGKKRKVYCTKVNGLGKYDSILMMYSSKCNSRKGGVEQVLIVLLKSLMEKCPSCLNSLHFRHKHMQHQRCLFIRHPSESNDHCLSLNAASSLFIMRLIETKGNRDVSHSVTSVVEVAWK